MSTGAAPDLTAVLSRLTSPDGQTSRSRVITGAGGTGKTTLLGQLAATLTDQGAEVRQCGWWAAEAGSPFQGLAGLLDPYALTDLAGRGTDGDRLACELAGEALGDGSVLLVDDAHRLDATALRVLCTVVRQRTDVTLVVTERPAPGASELARLHDAVPAAEPPLVLGPLSEEQLARLLEQELGESVDTDLMTLVMDLTGGFPRLSTLLARSWREEGIRADLADRESLPSAPAPLVEVLRREVDWLSPSARDLLVVLTLDSEPDPELLEHAATHAGNVSDGAGELKAAGLVDAASDTRVLPVVAQAVHQLVPATERRRVQAALGKAMVAVGGPPVPAADLLAAAGARGAAAAAVYVAAAEATVRDRPDDALGWLDQAVTAGADPSGVAAPRSEAAQRAGRSGAALRFADEALHGADDDHVRRALEISAAALGVQGQWARSAATYGTLSESPTGQPLDRARYQLLRVPGLLATGQATAAGKAARDGQAELSHAPLHVQAWALLADGLLSSVRSDPPASLARLLEAAELQETTDAPTPLPDSATAVTVLAAVHLCEFDLARGLLARAASGHGSGLPDARLRLLRAWVALRVGDWTEAREVVAKVAEADAPTPRDELYLRALEVGLARRYGTVDQLVRAWRQARSILLRHPVDLFALPAVGELVVAGARVGGLADVRAGLEATDELLGQLGEPALWSLPARWDQLQAAVAADDMELAEQATMALRALPRIESPAAVLFEAADAWWGILNGRVDTEAVRTAAERLHTAGLPWEGVRLAGAAAVRCRDPAAMRSLLAFARQLRSPLPTSVSGDSDPDVPLSDREREIAGHILAGLTYRQIGTQLFISPKTVEHHAANIRRKLAVSNRAELLTALRELLAHQ